MSMFDKLNDVDQLYENLSRHLGDPESIADMGEYQRVAKQHSDLTEVVTKFREYKATVRQIAETEEMLKGSLDDDLKEMAQAELAELKDAKTRLELELKLLLLPKDPNDERDVIIEIRGGTGGEEAALFAGELLRLYMRYAERQGWKYEIISSSESGIGGIKEAIMEVHGHGAYSRLKFEGGVHRVQRVPATESGGRIHTSAVTVVVMPEAEDVEIEIDMKDVIREHTLSQGAGGQNVQKNETAVRLTHKPTGMVVTCQDQRSQLQNFEKAIRVLKARLYEMEQAKQRESLDADRRGMVGSGDRSEKIRTYNFPQDRMTDHRINLTLHNLANIMSGDIQTMIDNLIAADQAEKLQVETTLS